MKVNSYTHICKLKWTPAICIESIWGRRACRDLSSKSWTIFCVHLVGPNKWHYMEFVFSWVQKMAVWDLADGTGPDEPIIWISMRKLHTFICLFLYRKAELNKYLGQWKLRIAWPFRDLDISIILYLTVLKWASGICSICIVLMV